MDNIFDILLKESEDIANKISGDDSILSPDLYLERNFNPLNIPPELSFLLGIPEIPSGTSDAEQKLYSCARHRKYHYKLLLLLGIGCEEDLNLLYPGIQRQKQIRLQMLKFNGTSKNCISVFYTLMGKDDKYDFVRSYPFKNHTEIESCKTPYEYIEWRKQEEERIKYLSGMLEEQLKTVDLKEVSLKSKEETLAKVKERLQKYLANSLINKILRDI